MIPIGDTCLVPAPPAPPIPTPFPNMAQCTAANGVVQTVVIENKQTVVQASKIPNSSGDEAGVNGGVASGVNMNQASFTLPSAVVYFGGKKAVYATGMSGQNGSSMNIPGMVVPGQSKVIVSP